MKKEQKNKIKSFLKKQGTKINIPFLSNLIKKSNVDVISKNLLSVLPNLEIFDDISDNFGKNEHQNLKRIGSFYINSNKNGNLVRGGIHLSENSPKFEAQNQIKQKNRQKNSNIIENRVALLPFEPKTNQFVSNASKTKPNVGFFDTSFEEKHFSGNFVVPKQPKIQYGMEWKLISGPKTYKFLVNAPKKDKQKLLEMVQTKKIQNKIEKISGNEYVITLPAYAEGKNLLNFGQSLLKSTGSVASKFLTATGKFAQNLSTRIDARLNPSATTAGGSEPPVITVLGEGQKKEAAVVGESGKETITSNSVIPENNVRAGQPKQTQNIQPTQSQSQDPTQNIQPTQSQSQDPTQNIQPTQSQRQDQTQLIQGQDLSSEQQIEQIQPEQKLSQQETKKQNIGSGFKTLSALSNAAMLIPGVGQIGMIAKGLSMVSKLGSVGKMLSIGGKTTGGGSILGKAGSVLGFGGSGSSSESSESNEQKEEDKPEGKSSGMFGGLGSALPGAAVAGGILAAGGAAAGLAVGAVGAGVGAAAKGLGALADGVGNLLGLSDESDEKKKANAAIAQDNRVTNTTFNNIVHQYDIYRKTADDSFMLPNHRREYG